MNCTPQLVLCWVLFHLVKEALTNCKRRFIFPLLPITKKGSLKVCREEGGRHDLQPNNTKRGRKKNNLRFLSMCRHSLLRLYPLLLEMWYGWPWGFCSKKAYIVHIVREARKYWGWKRFNYHHYTYFTNQWLFLEEEDTNSLLLL